MRVDIKIGLI